MSARVQGLVQHLHRRSESCKAAAKVTAHARALQRTPDGGGASLCWYFSFMKVVLLLRNLVDGHTAPRCTKVVMHAIQQSAQGLWVDCAARSWKGAASVAGGQMRGNSYNVAICAPAAVQIVCQS